MFSPRVIRRELKSILHLLEEKNFKNMTLDGGSSLNISMVKEWMTPLMANYCIIFDMNCNKRSIPDVYCPHTFILTKNVQAQKQNDKRIKSNLYTDEAFHIEYIHIRYCHIQR